MCTRIKLSPSHCGRHDQKTYKHTKKKCNQLKNSKPADSDDSDCDTLLQDKYLLNPKSFMTSTLKNLTELNCSKPTQPDHIDTTTNPPRVEHTNDNLPPTTRPGHTEVQANSSQTNAKDIEKLKTKN